MCFSSSKPAPPPVPAQAAPVTSATPEFDTDLAEVDTASQTAAKKKTGKAKLKVAPKNAGLAIGGSTSGGSMGSSSGVNISR